MKTVKIHQNFGRLRVGKLSNIGRVVLPPQEELKKLTEKADVFIKTCEKEFLYKSNPNRTMGTEALKISARPLKLGFWDKLFNKKTVTEYYPIGNMKDSVIYDTKKTVVDVIKDVVAKVKQP